MATAEQQIVEQKPIIVTESKPLHSSYWDKWIGKRMVFQTKSFTVISGTLKEFRNTFLCITDAQVSGTKHTAKPKEVMLDRNFISHFHEECEVGPRVGVTGDADVH